MSANNEAAASGAEQHSDDITVTDKEWEEYKTLHSKSYPDKTEDDKRRQIYTDNKIKIAQHNKKFKSGEVTFEMGINQFSDKSLDEMKKGRGCFKRLEEPK